MRFIDYYSILQVSPYARKEVIKASYRQISKVYHPDTSNYDGSEFIMIKEAYDILSNDDSRKEYHRIWEEYNLKNNINYGSNESKNKKWIFVPPKAKITTSSAIFIGLLVCILIYNISLISPIGNHNEVIANTTINYDNGDIYEGQVINNIQNGYGIYKFSNGDVYSGYFSDGYFSGKGTYVWSSSGDKYEGNFTDDLKSGFGIYQSVSEGVTYEGNFSNDIPNGYGIFKYDNGDMYEGNVLEGFFHGEGTYTYSNGETIKGIWKNGELINN